MQKTVIVLPNGKEISSGDIFEDAISSSAITQCVNSGGELTLGSVCSSMVELSIITKGGEPLLSAGDEITIYRENGDRNRTKVGLFIVEKPTQASKRSIKITAYDRVIKLDKDISEWVFNLSAWPYTLYDFAKMVCTECGLELTNLSLPNGSHLIKKFKAGGATGRSIMQKICEACGCFGIVNADGKFVIDWYKNNGRTIKISEIVGQSLNYEGYATYPIEKVQIKQTESDVGTIWPSTELKQNTYVISGNPLLTAETATELQDVAKNIYDRLHTVTYTPCKFSMFAPSGIYPGDVINVLDANGRTRIVYIMTKKTKGQREDFECVGSYRRDSVSRTNSQKFGAMTGKIYELETSVEGLRSTSKDLHGKITQIAQDTEKIIFSALERYVETSNFEQFKKEVSAQLAIMADEISMKFTETTEKIENVNGELQGKYESISKIIRATIDGIIIGASNSDTQLHLDNDVIEILVAGLAEVWIDKSGLTSEQATVNTLHIGNYTLSAGSDGSLLLT